MGDIFFDVRMKGFKDKQNVHQFYALIDKHICINPKTEYVPLQSLAGRRLAENIISEVHVPGFDRAAMDGYALLAEETYGASQYTPLEFIILDTSYPNAPCSKTVQKGTAIRIMTGAPVPLGATGVIPFELTAEANGILKVSESIPPGKNIGKTGEDIRSGNQVLNTGRTLRPQDIGILSSIGVKGAKVTSKPIVDLLVTGNELLAPGSRPTGYQIVDSNSLMLGALIQRDGGECQIHFPIPDDREFLKAKLLQSQADLIMVTGGSSVGKEDHAPSLVSELGSLAIHGVALRPASPSGFGFIGEKPVFLIPGNPVSCLCAYDMFAGRAVRILSGHRRELPYSQKTMRLAKKISSALGRVDYVRLQFQNGEAHPLAVSGASILSTTTNADGFLLVESSSEGYPEGAMVEVFQYEPWCAS